MVQTVETVRQYCQENNINYFTMIVRDINATHRVKWVDRDKGHLQSADGNSVVVSIDNLKALFKDVEFEC